MCKRLLLSALLLLAAGCPGSGGQFFGTGGDGPFGGDDGSVGGVDLTPLPARCRDGLENGDESDVDCGGTLCPACPANGKCLAGRDCQSQSCTNNRCDAPTCDDGFNNGAETDVDCGGPSCAPCGDG